MKFNIIKRFMTISAVVALASSCSGFLDESDQSKFIAETADHFSSVLLGTFNAYYEPFDLVPFMTDEMCDGIAVSTNNSTRETLRPAFCWQRDIEKNMTDYTQIDQSSYWAYAYKLIAICNNIMENIDATTESVKGEKAYVKAEACFVSALMYFNLVNLYAEPYRSATASSTMGIPLKETTGTETSYDRSMLDVCYAKIVSLLSDALGYLEESGLDYDIYYKIDANAVKLLLSRVYLFMGQWDNVISTLEPLMQNARLKKMSDDSGNDYITWTKDNREIVYAYGLKTYSSISSYCNSGYFNISEDLYNLYEDSDLRRDIWFNAKYNKDQDANAITTWKYGSDYSTVGQVVMRYGEAYLNIAEAYARKNDIQTASTYLMTFLSSRHESTDAITLPSSQDDFVSYIFDERLREFCLEEHFRWFDLRRMEESMRPVIDHGFKVLQATTLVREETYHLLQNDPNYTLSLPYKETDNNPMILDYDRFDKVPY